LVVFFTAVRDHDRSQPDTYLCQRDPAAVSGPSPGPDPGTSPLFEIITKTVRRSMADSMPVIFRTDQGAKFLQPTVYMAESTLFAHLYAIHKVPWHCALASLAPEDDMPAKNITVLKNLNLPGIQSHRSRLLTAAAFSFAASSRPSALQGRCPHRWPDLVQSDAPSFRRNLSKLDLPLSKSDACGRFRTQNQETTRPEYRYSTPTRLCEIRLIFRDHSILSCNVMRSSPSPHVLADSK